MHNLVTFSPTGAVCIVVGRGTCGWDNKYYSLREIKTWSLVAAMENQIGSAPDNVAAIPNMKWRYNE